MKINTSKENGRTKYDESGDNVWLKIKKPMEHHRPFASKLFILV